LHIVLLTVGLLSPFGLPRSVCTASRLLLVRATDTRVNVCVLSRRLSSEWLGPRSRISPDDVGKSFLWTVAAHRLLQTRYDVWAHPRAPSSSPALGVVKPCGFTPLVWRLRDVCLRRDKPRAASRNDFVEELPLSGKSHDHQRGWPHGALHLREGNRNRSGPTEPS